MLPTPKVQCQYCPHSFALRGLNRHQTTCKQNFDEQQDNALYEQQLFSTSLAQTIVTVPSGNNIGTAIEVYQSGNIPDPELIHPVPNNNIAAHPDPDNGIAASLPETSEESVHGASEYKLDDIRTVYHSSSGHPTQIAHFEDYFQEVNEFVGMGTGIDPEPNVGASFHLGCCSAFKVELRPPGVFKVRDFESSSDLQLEATLVHVIVSIVKLVLQRCSNVFEVKDFEFTVRSAIRSHSGPWEVIGDFIDSLLKITFFFHHSF
ncbi:hypothetical protein ARMGADRAFT_1036395 [Armillaria gallica]|uniref:Uncharacterized protein n=1 Tax=Armillaria gallica TaxID=47427 RepID=A0A2H3CU16_ARMGA|nr:hypothetical protein ARMGADRAFT_1036395 [Armillaria gallica]